jgi:hypothetical protein
MGRCWSFTPSFSGGHTQAHAYTHTRMYTHHLEDTRTPGHHLEERACCGSGSAKDHGEMMGHPARGDFYLRKSVKIDGWTESIDGINGSKNGRAAEVVPLRIMGK